MVGLRWYPTSGEAVAFLATAPLSEDELADRRAEGTSLAGSPEERERRDLENRARASRRARGRLRRYVVANGLTRMVTLTYGPTRGKSSPARWAGGGPPTGAEAVHGDGEDGRCGRCGRPYGLLGLAAAMQDTARFVRALRASLGVERLPYAMVPEFHKDHHVHVHVLLDRFVAERALQRVWPHGFVDVRKFRGSGTGGREAARHAAAYASKYVAKMFDTGAAARHRYEVAEGFQPAVVKRGGFRSFEDAVEFVENHGQTVVFAMHSDAVKEYDGLPFLWVALETSA